jgi:hypothetical protein
MKLPKTISVFIFASFVLSGLGAQTPKTDDLLTVAAGFGHMMTRFLDNREESGENLDRSFSWTVTEDETVIEFNNYRFYLIGSPDDSETVSLSGRLLAAGEMLNGSLSVGGIDFPEIRFSDFSISDDSSTSDRPCISIGDETYSWKDAEAFLSDFFSSFFDKSKIFDAEKESMLVFVFSFAAPSLLTWEDGGRLFPYSDKMPPRGEFTGNPSMSLGAVALDNGTRFIYQDFLFTGSIFPIAPLLKGSFDMLLPPEQEEGAYLAKLDGTVEAKNLRFIRLLRYNSCTVADEIDKVSGTVSIDGRVREFADFIAMLNTQF